MSNVQDFMNFLKSKSTGLKQKSADWVNARKGTIGASEVSALTEKSPFKTPKTLLKKKYNHLLCAITLPVHGVAYSSQSLENILRRNILSLCLVTLYH